MFVDCERQCRCRIDDKTSQMESLGESLSGVPCALSRRTADYEARLAPNPRGGGRMQEAWTKFTRFLLGILLSAPFFSSRPLVTTLLLFHAAEARDIFCLLCFFVPTRLKSSLRRGVSCLFRVVGTAPLGLLVHRAGRSGEGVRLA